MAKLDFSAGIDKVFGALDSKHELIVRQKHLHAPDGSLTKQCKPEGYFQAHKRDYKQNPPTSAYRSRTGSSTAFWTSVAPNNSPSQGDEKPRSGYARTTRPSRRLQSPLPGANQRQRRSPGSSRQVRQTAPLLPHRHLHSGDPISSPRSLKFQKNLAYACVCEIFFVPLQPI